MRWPFRLLACVGVLVLLAGAALGTASVVLDQDPRRMAQALQQRTPGELLRHAQRRLEGHPRLEWLLLPLLRTAQAHLERPVPGLLPALGKGQQPQPLAPVRYGERGGAVPLPPAQAQAVVAEPSANDVLLYSEGEIAAAFQRARPGQRLVIASGRYRFNTPLRTRAGGTAWAPIVVTAQRPGAVTLEFHTVEAVSVAHPYWVFENLHLRGTCGRHEECEHAFHVVGAARSTVLRNNLIEDFNAHVKVNGQGGQWPDDGLLQFNTLRNSTPRQTHKPVTLVDVVGASGWQLTDNVIANFVKAQGNGVSFGAFMKGGGRDGRMERNLVICTTQDISQRGTRAGLSFGGGGTEASYCRDGRCEVEHEAGLVANNIVAHCNDSGIYVFRSRGTGVAHNTLINTGGVEVRVPPADARVQFNIVEGRIRARDGGVMQEADNVPGSALPGGRERIDGLLLEPAEPLAHPRGAALPGVAADFCGTPRTASVVPGAMSSRVPCAQAGTTARAP
ncbi:hypothetical protein [uncultured Azohydromonas sp.]|uniref:hypothetical protein n=1 Tax=uncultured Azohydromonas sp. TaxID=487342 RepID=UPI00262F3F66|nr:hypothetical protein [uncultured Azohydromonas sp.]